MATQLSAITMIGTTGQGYAVGMSLLQFYYALPIAMIILAVTFVPFFHNARIFTAYEYLERRFDAKTRTFTALLFLFSRGLACGAVISAPAVVLSVMIGLDVTTTCLLIGVPDRDLHDVRRRAGRGVDRRQADVPDRRRARRRLHRADARAARRR